MDRQAKQLIVALSLMVTARAAWGARAVPARPRLWDLSGHRIEPLKDTSKKAIVFLFTRADCPVSNRYAPVIRRLHEKFSPQGVAFWLVYIDPGQGAKAIEKHMREYGYTCGVLRDPEHTLVALTGARVTPEAAVFVPGKPAARMVYRGRIDDQYVEFGVTRPAPTRHDLEEVLQDILKGKPLESATTRAVGCFISDLK